MFAGDSDAGQLGTSRRALFFAIGAAIVLILARSAVFLIWEQAAFDSDQATIGLMAKHIAEGRAFPMFLYGAQYLLAVEAWLAAPLFAIFGPSVAALRAPLVMVNLATAGLLLWTLHRDGRLTPVFALIAALFYVAAAPALALLLVDAGGANPEAFLYVLVLWVLRNQPLAFGAAFGFGFLHREFTLYGVTAIVLLSVLNDRRISPERLRAVTLAGVGYFVVWQLVRTGFLFSTPLGPGTPITAPLGGAENVEGLFGRACFAPAAILPGLGELFGSYLGNVFGANEVRLNHFGVRSFLSAGLPGLPSFWPLLGGVFAVVAVRVAWLSVRTRTPIWRGRAAVATFLLLVGLQAGVAYALTRCGGQLDTGTFRYAILSVYIGVGLVALFFIYESERWWRWSLAGLVVAWTIVSGASHARLLNEYIYHEPQSPHRQLATYLIDHGIQYSRSDYWTAYATTLLADERVVVASTGVVRVTEYETAAAAQGAGVVTVQREACASPGGIEAIPGTYWLCPAPSR